MDRCMNRTIYLSTYLPCQNGWVNLLIYISTLSKMDGYIYFFTYLPVQMDRWVDRCMNRTIYLSTYLPSQNGWVYLPIQLPVQKDRWMDRCMNRTIYLSTYLPCQNGWVNLLIYISTLSKMDGYIYFFTYLPVQMDRWVDRCMNRTIYLSTYLPCQNGCLSMQLQRREARLHQTKLDQV